MARLPADPTFEEIEEAGGIVKTNNQPHVVAGGTVYVSGEIPRVTPYETGLMGGVRFVDEGSGHKWIKEWVGHSFCSPRRSGE
jgi:7,8-dihydropterin-6-yl-methyl-4-(beta-D-ribofuranosyl)aminobenzene 5'-phosphate synthase